MRRVFVILGIVGLVVAGSAGCATKKFVTTRVGEVNTKVESLSTSLEETQERTRQNEKRIGEVDQKAAAADQKAVSAGKSADAARTAAAAANAKAEEVDRASKKLVYEVVLSEDKANFKFGSTDLPDEAKTEIDEMINTVKADPKGIYIEVEGHTDNVGTKEINHRLGLERAEAVKRYLYEQHQIPLHKINVISYGEEKPVGSNKTRDDRAKNRRVVIKVLA